MWSTTSGRPVLDGPDAFKQRLWNTPCLSLDKDKIWSSSSDGLHRARLLAVTAPHSGDWLNVLPVTNCGLRLDNEAIRVGIGLRLGSKLCEPHTCPCGASVDAGGTHGLACKKGVGRITRHHHINDLVLRALVRANIPSVKEPVGLVRSDGKRPDGLTLIPWQGGKSLTWDVTVSDTLARSYIPITSVTQSGLAEAAANEPLILTPNHRG